MLVSLATINDVIIYLDITLIKKSDDKFNDFIDQNFLLLVMKWGELIYKDVFDNAFNEEEYLQLGYNFKPNTEAIKIIIYNQDGNENEEYRAISMTYKSKAYLDAQDEFLDCSFSLK